MLRKWMIGRCLPGQRSFKLALGGALAFLCTAPALAAAVAGISALPNPGGTTATQAEHLRQGLENFDKGEYENAVLEFEMVLRRTHFPASPHQRAELYADAARQYLAGSRFQVSGYGLLGLGNYAENDTEAGGAEINNMFVSARIGGRANYELSAGNTLNLSLDYRFRAYDENDRRNDSDLRWNANISHSGGAANVAFGIRGRASDRGNGQTRNDYGVFTELRWLTDPDDQFNFGAELRRRNYPQGPLRERSRNIVEFTGGWTHALFDGRASFNLAAGAGLEVATDDRPDGDSAFVNVSPSFNFTIAEHWGGYAYLWWQNDAYSVDRLNSDLGDSTAALARRNDDLLEIGGGLTWEFGRNWSLNPEIVYIRDYSNVLFVNYSSTELHLTFRKDF